MKENKIELCFNCSDPCILNVWYNDRHVEKAVAITCASKKGKDASLVKTFVLTEFPPVRPGRHPKYPLAELLVGEIREITPDPGDTPATCRRKLTLAVAQFHKKFPDRQFACRNVDGKIVCVRIV